MLRVFQNPFPGLAAGLLVVSHLAAQAPASRSPEVIGTLDRQSLIAGAHGLAGDGDELVGFGPDYSARFGRDGVAFTPALGRRAPTQQRVTLELDSIRRGGFAVAIDPDVEPEHEGSAVEYRRSASVTERYDLKSEGVEQSFVFAALPGRGELVVRCRVAGELASQGQVDDQGGVRFLRPALGGVVISGVIGIDATGARCAGALRFADGALELSLPAAFVDRAEFPLVLDPLVAARIDVGAGPSDDREPDVAYDATTGDYLVVWTRALSSAATELRARVYNEVSGLGTAFLVASGDLLRRPKICSHNAINRFVIVYESAASVVAPSTVVAQVINADRTLGPSVDITAGTSSCVEPAVSGNIGTGAGDIHGAIVYREVGVGIKLASYTLFGGNTGALTVASATTVALDSSAEHPRVSKSSGNRLVVVFGRPGQAIARSVSVSGTLNGPIQSVPSGGTAVPSPDVDGDGDNFLMVFDTEIAPGDRDIRCAQWTWNGAGLTNSAFDAVSQKAGVDEFQPVVALLGPKYLVAWTEASAFLAYQVHAKAMSPLGCQACGLPFTLTGSLASNVVPAIASQRSGGSASLGALITFASHAAQLPFQGDIVAWRFTAFSGTSQATLWNGCGNPPIMQPQGPCAIGNSDFALRLSTGDPAAVLSFVSVGLGGAPLVCGPCTLVAPLQMLIAPTVGGVSTYPLPVPCVPALIGGQLDLQGGVVGSDANLCFLLPSLSLSSAIRLTFAD